MAVHSPGSINHWTASEGVRTTMQAPTIVYAYNYVWYLVDRMDQLRSTASRWQKEKHLSIKSFTLAMDMATNSAISI